MRTAHLLLAAATVAGVTLGVPVQAAPAGVAAPTGTNLVARAIDLGTLGGKQSEARAVDGSVVVGWSQIAVPNQRHAFAYDLSAARPEMIDLGSIRGRSDAHDVDGSVVVGEFDTASEGHFGAFAYDLAVPNPAMRDLGTLGGGSAIARAVSGTIVTGMSETASGEEHAFAYDLGAAEPTMVDLGTLGGRSSDATAIDGSVVVGYSSTTSGEQHAFACDLAAAEPRMIDLGTLGGGDSLATGVAGSIVTGESRTSSGEFHAFAYDLAAVDPIMRDLDTLGGPDSIGRDVSGATVVGSSSTRSGKARAFAYDVTAAEPRMRNLGTVPGGAATRVQAAAIDGDLVIGRWDDPRQMGSTPYSFAYDLGGSEGTLFDLGTWRGSSIANDVDGHVAVGTADRGPAVRATAWVLRETTRPLFTFQRLERRVKEGAGSVTVRVTRYGRTDRAVSVRYQTHHDTAMTGKDFASTAGTLHFPAGVTQRKFTVRILDDRRSEGAEYLLLGLSHPTEPGRIGRLSWSQVRIGASDR